MKRLILARNPRKSKAFLSRFLTREKTAAYIRRREPICRYARACARVSPRTMCEIAQESLIPADCAHFVAVVQVTVVKKTKADLTADSTVDSCLFLSLPFLCAFCPLRQSLNSSSIEPRTHRTYAENEAKMKCVQRKHFLSCSLLFFSCMADRKRGYFRYQYQRQFIVVRKR